MSLTRMQIALFFTAVALMGFFLFPRGIFLAFIFEGADDLARAETYYTDFLKDHPDSLFAVERLASLFERTAEPSKAVPLFERLYRGRHGDWKVARAYLDFLESVEDEPALDKLARRIAADFKGVRGVKTRRVLWLLSDAYERALWRQHYDEAYAILDEIRDWGGGVEWEETREFLDRSLVKRRRVYAALKARLSAKPGDAVILSELVGVTIALGRLDEALTWLDELLKAAPRDVEWRKTRAFLNSKLGRYAEAVKDIETLLVGAVLDPGAKRKVRLELADMYRKADRPLEALAVYRLMLVEKPTSRRAWLSVIDMLGELKRWHEVIVVLNEYLPAFPRDIKRRRLRAEIRLYELKDPWRLDVYKDYLAHRDDVNFALDVAYLLLEHKHKARAAAWLENIFARHPADTRVAKALAGLYAETEKFNMAARVLAAYLKYHPDDADAVLDLAGITARLGRKQLSGRLFERYAALASGPAADKIAGRELLYLGMTETALGYLTRARDAMPEDHELWFYLAEGYHERGEFKLSTAAFNAVLARLSTDEKTAVAGRRVWLKSRAALGGDAMLDSDYRVALADFPRDEELPADYLAVIIEKGDAPAARRLIADYRRRFPGARGRLESHEITLALRDRKWIEAMALIHTALRKTPDSAGLRRDLAEAYVGAEQSRAGINEYEKLKLAGELRHDGEKRLAELHEATDYRVGAGFSFVGLGDEDALLFKSSFAGQLGDDWRIEGSAGVGDYDSTLGAKRDTAVLAKTAISFHGTRRWRFTAGAGFGMSSARNTAAPRFEAVFKPAPTTTFTAGGLLRELRADVPQAVTAGALEDKAELKAETLPWRHLALRARYDFSRTVLPGGQTSIGHLIEPAAAWVILNDPYLALGYQFTFSDQGDSGGFLSRLSLIPRRESHFVTLYAAKDFGVTWRVEGGMFWGFDPARDLDFFVFDLFGLNAQARWRASPSLDVKLAYDFGNETFAGASGQSHQGSLGVSWHWF